MEKSRVWRPASSLLGCIWEGVTHEYGPQSQIVVSAMESLVDLYWCDHVGQLPPLNAPRHLRLGSWTEAVERITEGRDGQIDRYGNLEAPAQEVAEVVACDAQVRSWHRSVLERYEGSVVSKCCRGGSLDTSPLVGRGRGRTVYPLSSDAA